MKHFEKLFFIVLIVAVFFSACDRAEKTDQLSEKDYLNESKSDFDNRMEWWRDAGFGMFIHWGVYSVPAGVYNGEGRYAEWIMDQADIPVEEYEKYAAKFNPVKFDADEWVRMAKDAGMKYIVITSKHHDGFCMWDSKFTDYDIVDATPFKRDVIKELSEACEKQDMVLCFYHSIMDWHHPDAKGDSFSKYREEYLKPQLKELLTNYGKIGVMWFDGEWIGEWTEEQGRDLYNYVRSLQPDIIINNRVGKGRAGMQGMMKDDKAVGDFGTPEQEILEGSASIDWESCMTMNNHWGFASYDKSFKSSELLIHNIVDVAAKGGNYLLNIGPTAEGTFPEESIERLKEIGEWMKINGEIVHNSGSLDNYQENDFLYYTKAKDGNLLYAIVTKWPGERLIVRFVKPEPGTDVKLLGYDNALEWQDLGPDGVEIKISDILQKAAHHQKASAWVFKMKGTTVPVVKTPIILNKEKDGEKEVLFTNQAEVSITTPTTGAIIYYTLDGTDPDKNSSQYLKPIVIQKSMTIKSFAEKENLISSAVATTDFQKISSVKNITLVNPPNSKYIASGALTLVNGRKGRMNYDAGEWLGWAGDDMEATIDIGKQKAVKRISARFLQAPAGWIFIPQYVEFYVSQDGENYEQIAKMDLEVPTDEAGRFSKTFSVDLNGRYRYVRVFAKNLGVCPEGHSGAGEKAWLFSDEIVIE